MQNFRHNQFKSLTLGAVLLVLISLQTLADVNLSAASGGGNLSADTAANAVSPGWTSLGSITMSEPGNQRNSIGAGSLILKAPTGFEFNTGVTPNISYSGGKDIQSANISVTDASTLTITLSVNGSNDVDSLTIGGTPAIQVRPVSGTPLTTGNIYRPSVGGGTASILGIDPTANPDGSGGTSLGLLRSVPGAASQLEFQTAPPATAAVGEVLSPAIVLRVLDQFGTLRSSANGLADNSTVVTAAINGGGAELQGTTNTTAANGVVTFNNLFCNQAGIFSLSFASPGVTTLVSDPIQIGAGPPTQLVFTTQPGPTEYGQPLTPQPVLALQDNLGNNSSTGLPASQLVTITLSSGDGTLLGTTVLDIGTAAGNGIATFTDLQLDVIGTNKQLTASTSGFSDVVSEVFSILPATVVPIVTVSNKSYDGTTTAAIATRNLAGVVGGDAVSLTGGAAYFADKDVGLAKLVTITNLSLTGMAATNYALSTTTTSTNADITKAVLSVVADNQARLLGDANPPLTTSYFGFAGEETLATSGVAGSPSLSCAANASSGVGSYPIAAAVGSLSAGNYDFALLAGMLTVLPATNLFFDDFSRTNDPGVLSPWQVQSGVWAATNGNLRTTGNPVVGYNMLHITNSWTNYAVEGVLKFAAGSYGGGLGGRLNPATGEQYMAWVYPEGSTAGSNVLRLVKFSDWENFGYTNMNLAPMAQVNLPSVGTNWHSLRLGFTGNKISVTYDGSMLINLNDVEAQPLSNGAISAAMWSEAPANGMLVDNVFVTPITGVPVARSDDYTLNAHTTLSVPAPGVLSNDDGESLSAQLVNSTSHGNLSLNPSGSFDYTPTNGFVGVDEFTYQATTASQTSGVATVTLTVSFPELGFTDDFSRTNEPGTLSPWIPQLGNWTITSGVLRAGLNSPQNYGVAYVPGNWSYISVEGKLRFVTPGYGGGFGGHLNPTTGARYAAWIYPAGSGGGSNVLKLIKFSTWDIYGYNNVSYVPMQQAAVADVGTNWHNLKLEFVTNQIAVTYDGVPVMTVTDIEAQPLAGGGVSAEMWTDAMTYYLEYDDVVVKTPEATGPPMFTGIANSGGGAVTLSFSGTPNTAYLVQAATNLAPPVVWQTIATNTTAPDGTGSYLVPAPALPERFFRLQ